MDIKSFYRSTFFRSLAEALISPFIPIFALSLGATKALIGLASTLPTLANLLSQLFWGSLSETMEKKSMLIILGGIAWAVMWIPIALVKDPMQLVILLTIQSLLAAASVPAWTALLIQIVPGYKRAYITGNLNLIDSAGSLLGTLLGGLVLNKFGFIPFLFYIIAFLGIISRLPFFWAKEAVTYYYNDRSLANLLKRTFDFSRIKQEKELIRLMMAITFLNFSVGLAGPFLSVYIVTGMKGNLMDVAIISAIGVISAMAFYRPWGMIIDRFGKRSVMLACIIPISFIPFVYAIANEMGWLYLYNVIGTMSWAGFNLAAFSYLADILPKERTSSSIAIYNLFVGLGSAAGPLIGGMLADVIGLYNIFFISTVLRLVTVFFLDRLGEKPGFRPRGIFRLGFETLGLNYKIENFVNTYSLVIDEALKESTKLLDFRKQLKKKRLF
jgi:MFS family permease